MWDLPRSGTEPVCPALAGGFLTTVPPGKSQQDGNFKRTHPDRTEIFRWLLKNERDFPGGPLVKNPPSNAGDAHSIPGQGTKIPHAAGHLSPRATTTEFVCHN